ncbi:hypothetical protein BLA60_02050 [Actinophytocola xinjiangensis]|uniref:N-acetyltransferase domain-containing protein n=1 Tax=Actinophytocola xinjiangensis TaxID=485602 RepID=A0A7Z0WT87_9PSEU|nr:hypothetical protein BLA60_02050 [Actinophytocola xinjiangensis]
MDALVALGVPADQAEVFVDEDMVLDLAGHTLLVSVHDEDMTGRARGFVALGAESLLGDPAALTALRAELTARAGGPTTVVVRLGPGHEPPEPLGARLISRYLTAGQDVRLTDPAGEWTVRRYRAADRDAVAELLLAALREGYRILGDGPVEGLPEAYVASLLDREGDEVTVFTAHHGEVFTGHATLMYEEDDLTGTPQLELFDLFVLGEWRGTEAGRLLTTSAIRHAREAGLPLRGHVAGDDDNAVTVAARLCAAGWLAAESYWELP